MFVRAFGALKYRQFLSVHVIFPLLEKFLPAPMGGGKAAWIDKTYWFFGTSKARTNIAAIFYVSHSGVNDVSAIGTSKNFGYFDVIIFKVQGGRNCPKLLLPPSAYGWQYFSMGGLREDSQLFCSGLGGRCSHFNFWLRQWSKRKFR